MSLPIYHEIPINQNDEEHIISTIGHAPIGKIPCYFTLKNIADDEKSEVIDLIYQGFLILGLNDSFPYPTYIVSHIKNDAVPIRQFSMPNKMPRFFMNKSKRLNAKENVIYSKNQLKIKRLNNLMTPEKLSDLHSLTSINLAFKTAVDESEYLQEILKTFKAGNK